MRVFLGIALMVLLVGLAATAADDAPAVIDDAAVADVPSVRWGGGVISSVLPAFDFGGQFVVAYRATGFETTSRTSFSIVPIFSLREEATLSFETGLADIGVDVGLSIVPFRLDTVDVWAATPLLEERLGEDESMLLTADIGGRIGLGAALGFDIFADLVTRIEGEAVSVLIESETSFRYGEIGGLAVEEDFNVRAEFQAPGFFAGQLLSEEDLTQIACWATARMRLSSGGLTVPGVIVGIELTVDRFLPEDP